LSFDVTRLHTPVLVKIPYFPNWEAVGATGPYEVSPNLMVVVPTSHKVTLLYGTSKVDWAGKVASLAGVVGLGMLVSARPPDMGRDLTTTESAGADLTNNGPAGSDLTTSESVGADLMTSESSPAPPGEGPAPPAVPASPAGGGTGWESLPPEDELRAVGDPEPRGDPTESGDDTEEPRADA